MAFPEKCQPPWPLKRARGIDESRKMGEIASIKREISGQKR